MPNRLIRCLNRNKRGKVCGYIFTHAVDRLGSVVRCPRCRGKVRVTEYNSCLAETQTQIDNKLFETAYTIHGNTKGSYVHKRNKYRHKYNR